MSPPNPVLLITGSGPGIGLSTAKAFARKNSCHFGTIVLVSRNAERLAKEKAEVEQEGHAQVVTYSTDLANFEHLKATLKEVEKLGPLGCIFFNAATVRMSEVLTTGVGEIEEDFRVTNLALYITAQWGIPLLQKSGVPSPSLIVTNSHLPENPIPAFLSLSAVKASQQNITHSLRAAFGEEIHIGVIKVSGLVREDAKNLNPKSIAEGIVGFYEQPKEKWGEDLVLMD